MKLLQGKVAIVTGAARGIGEAIAIKFAEHGANVAFTYVSDSSAEKASALETKLQGMGVKAKAYKSNAGDFAQCEVFVNDVLKEFGAIDICVNNAGISKDNLLLRMTPDQWNDVIQINLNSVFYMTKQVIRPMMKAKNGVIINMSSIIGEMGNAGQTSYAVLCIYAGVGARRFYKITKWQSAGFAILFYIAHMIIVHYIYKFILFYIVIHQIH